MASAPENALPLFFKDLQPLSSVDHANWKARPLDAAPWLAEQHAVPVTVEDGTLIGETYVPAYVRRYPFLLAKLRDDADELSLCFDPTADAVGVFEEGDALFENGQPTDATKSVLAFCEQFEQAGQRTSAFMAELVATGLLMDGEVSIQTDGDKPPYIYRGFQMVDENKLRELKGDKLRKMNQSGMLPLLYAHLFSLGVMREIFGRQMTQGKVPEQAAA
jgi:SapC